MSAPATTVVGSAASVATIQSYLNSIGNSTSEVVTIPGRLLAPNRYSLTLYVTNWFLASSLFTVYAEVSSNTDTPTALILGANSKRVPVMVRTSILIAELVLS